MKVRCSPVLLFLPLLVVVYQFQQNYQFSNNTSVITYVHRMIISPSCLFKHMNNDERVAMLFQCLLDQTQHKLYSCLISLLRNNVSKSVYVHQFQTLCILTLTRQGLLEALNKGYIIWGVYIKDRFCSTIQCSGVHGSSSRSVARCMSAEWE